MKANEQLDRLIADQSSEWIAALARKDGEDHAAFAEWLRDSKRHVNIFLMMTALDRELEHFDPERRHAVSRLSEGGAEVIPLNQSAEPSSPAQAPSPLTATRGKSKRSWSRFGWLSLAAGLVATLTLLVAQNQWSTFTGGWKEYSTAVGEQRVVELKDGSTVRLNTQSRIAVRLSEHTRDIRLIDGEAIFKVHHDTARPFRVHTLGAFIQAVGTEFNVYRRADRTKVAVLEGRVQISSGPVSEVSVSSGAAVALSAKPVDTAGHESSGTAFEETQAPKAATFLSAGEEAEIDNSGHVADQHHADVGSVAAWSARRLVFKQESLAEIVTQFNRYNRSPQFKVIGASIAERRYSGAFNADDPQSLRALLSSEPDLVVEEHGDEIVIRSRPQVRTAETVP